MADLTSLIIKVSTLGVGKATKELDGLTKQSKKTEKGAFDLAATLRSPKVLGALAVLTVGVLALVQSFKATREMEEFRRRLARITNGVEGAADAYETLNDFAKETPFSFDESLDAMERFKRSGLDVSIEALENFGDVAVASRIGLEETIGIVAKAAQGKFGGLDKLGVIARKSGDEVTLTFEGVETTVKNTSKNIEGYLSDLAKNEFAGEMGKKMDTIDGKFLKLESQWQSLGRSFESSSLGDFVKDTLDIAIGALEELEALLRSGHIQRLMNILTASFKTDTKEFKSFGDSLHDNVIDPIQSFFVNGAALELTISAFGTFGNAIAFLTKGLGELGATAQVAFAVLSPGRTAGMNAASWDIWKKQIEAINVRFIAMTSSIEAAQTAARNFDPSDNTLDPFKATGDPDAENEETATGVDPFEAVRQGLLFETELLDEELEKRLAIITDAHQREVISYFEMIDFKNRADTEHAMGLKKIQDEILAEEFKANNARITDAARLFGSLSDLALTFGSKGFAVAQGLAIASATMDAFGAWNRAMNDGTEMSTTVRLVKATAIIAQGLANVASIATQKPSFEQGGIVGGSNFSGDHVSARVNSGEMILTRAQQANLFKQSNSPSNMSTGGNGAATVNIINQTTDKVEANVIQRDNGQLDIVIRRAVDTAKAEITDEINAGFGGLSPVLERTFGLQRGN